MNQFNDSIIKKQDHWGSFNTIDYHSNQLFKYQRISQIDVTNSHLIACSSDGGQIAAICGNNIEIFNMQTNSKIILAHKNWITSMKYSPDNLFIVSGCKDFSVRVWDANSGVQVHKFIDHTEVISGVLFLTNTQIITASHDETIRVWNITNGTQKCFQCLSSILSIDGSESVLASTHSDQFIKIWKVRTGLNKTLKNIRNILCIRVKGNLISAIDSDSIIIYDLKTCKQINLFRGHTSFVSTMDFSPDKRFLASGSRDQTIRLWDITTRTNRVIIVEQSVYSIQFSSDGRYFIQGCGDYKIRLLKI